MAALGGHSRESWDQGIWERRIWLEEGAFNRSLAFIKDDSSNSLGITLGRAFILVL